MRGRFFNLLYIACVIDLCLGSSGSNRRCDSILRIEDVALFKALLTDQSAFVSRASIGQLVNYHQRASNAL